MADNTQYQKVKEITDQLERGIQELFESEKYMSWLRTMSKFHDYSLNNTLLIAFQRPDATMVAGYTAWQKQFGRQVQKGEKAIKILAPAPYKEKIEMEKIDPVTKKPVFDADGKPVTEVQEVTRPAFKVVNVFDVSQTDGRELPSLGVDELSGEVREYEMFFEALKRSCPVPIEFENMEGSAKGYYHQVEQRIAIRDSMSQVQTIKTAIHEMAHQRLHAIDPKEDSVETPKQTRSSKEVEAESVAYTVCQHYGIETSDYSFAYVAGWSHGKETPELKASLNIIRKAASEMITEIDSHIAELSKEMEHEITREEAALRLAVDVDSFLREINNYQYKHEVGDQIAFVGDLQKALMTGSERADEIMGWFQLVMDEDSDYTNEAIDLVVKMDKMIKENREFVKREQAEKLAGELYDYADEVDPYGSRDSVEYIEEFIQDTSKDLLEADDKAIGILKWLKETPVPTEDLEMRGQELIEKVSAFTGLSIEPEATISFYAAECSEFPELGEFHDGLTLEEAFQFYEQIPSERMNGIKGIGFELHDGSIYEGQYPLMQAGEVDEEAINIVQYYKESPLVQQAIADCKRILAEKNISEQKMTKGFYQVGEEHFLEIHKIQNEGWDYSIYNKEFLDEDHGRIGVIRDKADNLIETTDMDLTQAVNEVLKSYGLENEEFFPMDKEKFEQKRDFAFAKDMYEKGFVYEDYVLTNRVTYELRQDGIELMDFTSEQSALIYGAAEKGMDVRTFANPDFSVNQMKLMRDMIEDGKDVTEFVMNNKKMDLSEKVLTQKQIQRIQSYLKEEKDVSITRLQEKQEQKRKSVLADLQKKQGQVAGANASKNEQTKKNKKEMQI